MEIPLHVQEMLNRISISCNPLYFEDKMEICSALYIDCETFDDVYDTLNLRQIWRIFTQEKALLDKEVLGEKYKAVVQMYWEAVEKYS